MSRKIYNRHMDDTGLLWRLQVVNLDRLVYATPIGGPLPRLKKDLCLHYLYICHPPKGDSYRKTEAKQKSPKNHIIPPATSIRVINGPHNPPNVRSQSDGSRWVLSTRWITIWIYPATQ